MTYCVGLCLKDGLVMLSDTRTNAGVDNVSTFSKMHIYEIPGERFVTVMTAGNLGVSQAIVNMLHEGIDTGERLETVYTVPSMFRAAQLAGEAVRRVFHSDGPTLEAQQIKFDVSILIGGQLKGQGPRLFQIYAAGNFIEATPDTPFLQIGETKYGKPILDRVLQYDTDPRDGVKLVMVSMDSTLRSNLSVGMPLDLMVYRRDAMKAEIRRRITESDPYFRMIHEGWSEALRDAYRAMPRPEWME
ncbi:MAG TPA: proteasome-type protease [Stellaceae bacterium]|nr:proteasome-type protease [Stellaceae bacterium]